ncbi:septal ring lytic transglycosylase RlpA family protein [Adhaeribacter pallidiroseus]|uniref:Probable endolytic peptidoglycan transglycosylase RlpA n=1 Tax=Adhaeribacter pallidiroseus TaxID=2072847 RepID=A0A369QPN0_9BACT|nr:septal ring lytic transglycosylase RlpA family protein [Adhaeribacter pallidiroseus]RDC65207.1 RlpA-like lipoprotein [Adhaeribacter pallidiroseus]
MMLSKLPYVFSFTFLIFCSLSFEGFAQNTGSTTGSATWYGSQHHGKKTSSGEVFNKNQMTAAHKYLPFGTKVKVTNIVTQESVVVKINDRGSFRRKGHIIDLSEAAARRINVGGGTKVKVQVLSATTAEELITLEEPESQEMLTPVVSPLFTATSYFVIQAGSFSDPDKARSFSDKIKAFIKELPIATSEDTVNGKKIHRVVAGKFNDRSAAEQAKAELEKNGIMGMVKQINSGS